MLLLKTRSDKRYIILQYTVKKKVSKEAEKKTRGKNKEHVESVAFHLRHIRVHFFLCLTFFSLHLILNNPTTLTNYIF